MLMKNPQTSRFAQGVRSLTGLVLVLAAVAAATVLGWRLLDGPFGRTEIDHSAPPVLIQLRDLAEFRDHRQHDFEFAPASRFQKCADLRFEQARTVKRQAN